MTREISIITDKRLFERSPEFKATIIANLRKALSETDDKLDWSSESIKTTTIPSTSGCGCNSKLNVSLSVNMIEYRAK